MDKSRKHLTYPNSDWFGDPNQLSDWIKFRVFYPPLSVYFFKRLRKLAYKENLLDSFSNRKDHYDAIRKAKEVCHG